MLEINYCNAGVLTRSFFLERIRPKPRPLPGQNFYSIDSSQSLISNSELHFNYKTNVGWLVGTTLMILRLGTIIIDDWWMLFIFSFVWLLEQFLNNWWVEPETWHVFIPSGYEDTSVVPTSWDMPKKFIFQKSRAYHPHHHRQVRVMSTTQIGEMMTMQH